MVKIIVLKFVNYALISKAVEKKFENVNNRRSFWAKFRWTVPNSASQGDLNSVSLKLVSFYFTFLMRKLQYIIEIGINYKN